MKAKMYIVQYTQGEPYILVLKIVQWAVSLLDFTELEKLLRVTLASQIQARNLRAAKKFECSSNDGVS
jgi:hypothetical protein